MFQSVGMSLMPLLIHSKEFKNVIYGRGLIALEARLLKNASQSFVDDNLSQ